jgi:hypothetical protein
MALTTAWAKPDAIIISPAVWARVMAQWWQAYAAPCKPPLTALRLPREWPITHGVKPDALRTQRA